MVRVVHCSFLFGELRDSLLLQSSVQPFSDLDTEMHAPLELGKVDSYAADVVHVWP